LSHDGFCHFSILFRLVHFVGFLSKLHGNYGSVVRLWLGPSQLLVSVKDPTLIKEVLTKAEDKLPLAGRTYTLACGRLGLFVSSFEKVSVNVQVQQNVTNIFLFSIVAWGWAIAIHGYSCLMDLLYSKIRSFHL
jgi:hypothetical protein